MTGDAPTGGRPYRPPVGIPGGPERRWRGVLAAILVHAALIALLLVPAVGAAIVALNPRAAGLFGRPGGGGGGGGGGARGGHLWERLHYIQIAPDPPPPPVRVAPTPHVPKPVPVAPAREPPTAAVVPPASAETTQVASAPGAAGESAPGAGAGPGTGGGTGSGQGSGTGSGRGPGTGGEGATKIRASTKFFNVYVDPPKGPRPFHLVAVFAVAANGTARLLTFNKADDGAFNRKVHDRLLETEFHPATLRDGTPVSDTVEVTADY